MEFRLLGPLEVSSRGSVLPLGGEKQRGLLAILVLRANQVVPRERLIDGLWGDAPPRTVATELNVYVSRLRKLLGAGSGAVLRTSPGAYALEVDLEAVDVRRAERLLDAGRDRLADGDPGAAVVLLGEALALWRGPPLLDLAHQPYARDEIAQLEELRLEVAEARLEAELRLGRHAEIVRELGRLVAEHPFRERLRARLMLALYRSGRQIEALEVYDEGRRLTLELGLRPGRELRRLELAILREDHELDQPERLFPASRERGASSAEAHERFAAWLERRGEVVSPVWEELLAFHLEQAFVEYEAGGATPAPTPLGRRAAILHARAGRRALDAGDLRGATSFLGRARWLQVATGARGGGLALELGDMLLGRGDFAGAYAALSEAADLGDAGTDAYRSRLRLLASYVRAHVDAGERGRLRAVAERALDVFAECGDDAGLSRAFAIVADSGIPPTHGLAAAERSRHHAERAGDRRLVADAAFIACKQAALGPASAELVKSRLTETLALARLQGDRGLEARLLAMAGVHDALGGHVERGQQLVREGRSALKALGRDLGAAAWASAAARVSLLAGDAHAAEREARTALHELRAMGDQGYGGTVASWLARALCEQGRAAEALPFASHAKSCASPDDVIEQVEWRLARGAALSRLGAEAEALDLARAAVAIAEPTELLATQADALLALAAVLSSSGRRSEGADAAERARSLYERKGAVVPATRAAALALP